VLIVIAAVAAAIFYTWQRIQVTHLSIKIQRLAKSLEQLERKNMWLTSKLNKYTSVEKIGEKAEHLGLIYPDSGCERTLVTPKRR